MKAISKRNKKEQREINKRHRVIVTMNTGTRTHRSKKDYKRVKHIPVEEE